MTFHISVSQELLILDPKHWKAEMVSHISATVRDLKPFHCVPVVSGGLLFWAAWSSVCVSEFVHIGLLLFHVSMCDVCVCMPIRE